MRARGAAARHRACYVAVLTSAGELVVHRRADWKDVYPGYWDVCFGGVLGAGEAWDDAAHRELQEEAGIDAPLELLGISSWEAPDARLNGRVYLGAQRRAVHLPRRRGGGGGHGVPPATYPTGSRTHDVCPDSVDLVVPLLPR